MIQSMTAAEVLCVDDRDVIEALKSSSEQKMRQNTKSGGRSGVFLTSHVRHRRECQ